MNKFDIKQPECAFCLYNQSNSYLFEFGCKKYRLNSTYVYKENNNALVGQYVDKIMKVRI